MAREQVTEIVAEMVANVLTLTVEPGERVAAGDTVVLLESMKMEIPLVATVNGHVSRILVELGQIVQEGDPIVEIDETAGA